MHLSAAALILALTTTIVATPISPLNGVNNACYYKRDIDAYVRRDASKAEILCGKVKQQITGTNKRSHTHTLASETIEYETTKEKRGHGAGALGKVTDDSGTYKRHHIAQNKADASTSEKGHHATESEISEINKRIPPPSSNDACYYKRDLVTGELIALKRDASNAEINCGSV